MENGKHSVVARPVNRNRQIKAMRARSELSVLGDCSLRDTLLDKDRNNCSPRPGENFISGIRAEPGTTFGPECQTDSQTSRTNVMCLDATSL